MLTFGIVVVLLLILLNAFFALSEMAVVSSRRARLEQMAEEGNRGARAAVALLDEPTGFLSTVQTGITLISVLNGAYSGATLAEPLGDALVPLLGGSARPASVAVMVIAITYLSLVVGELVPKRAALNDPERIAARVSPFMAAMSVAGGPAVWLLRISTEALLRLLRVPEKPTSTVTEEEVKSLIAEGTRAGVFNPAERDMIDGVLRLADRSVRSVMTPRVDVIWVDLDDPADVIETEIADSGHSRFPAARGSLDEFDGVIHSKDLLDQIVRTGRFDLAASLRPALVIHEATPVLKLLEMFQENPVHMAIVVDEYGVFEGVVTPTDILISIAGDLPEDETDLAAESAVRRDDGSWLLDGMLGIHEVERLLARKDMRDDEDFETLAGFVLARFGQIPQTGDRFSWDGLRFEIVDMDGRRIDKILVSPEPQRAEAGETELLG